MQEWVFPAVACVNISRTDDVSGVAILPITCSPMLTPGPFGFPNLESNPNTLISNPSWATKAEYERSNGGVLQICLDTMKYIVRK